MKTLLLILAIGLVITKGTWASTDTIVYSTSNRFVYPAVDSRSQSGLSGSRKSLEDIQVAQSSSRPIQGPVQKGNSPGQGRSNVFTGTTSNATEGRAIGRRPEIEQPTSPTNPIIICEQCTPGAGLAEGAPPQQSGGEEIKDENATEGRAIERRPEVEQPSLPSNPIIICDQCKPGASAAEGAPPQMGVGVPSGSPR